MAGDLNREASELWNSLKPIIDKEIDARTQGMVQRRKAKVTTAPSLNTNKIGVTEPFGSEMFIPFNTNIMSASVGDYVWVEYMYGMTNAFASMFASADEKDWYVAGDLFVRGNEAVNGNLSVIGDTTLNGVFDITPRRCEATLSGEGWYRAIVYNAYDTLSAQGTSGEIVTIRIVYTSSVSVQHEISLWMSYGKVAFLNETSHGTTNIIDKVRYTYSGATGYIDIHYTTATALDVNVSFDVASRNYAQARWVSGSLQSVGSSPSGETVLTEYALNANGAYNGNVTVGGVLDVTQRRCYSAQLDAGWHRVLVFTSTDAGYRMGATGNEIVFHITRRRTNAGEETHEIKMLCQYDNVSFVDEVSKSLPSYQRITKIRYTYDGTNGYVDIYVSTTSAHVTVDFEVYCEPAYQALYTAAGLQSVVPSPSGETVLTEYSFAETVPESGSGYTKNPDGTLIQWGIVSGLSFSNENIISGTANLPISFANTNYMVIASAITTGVNQYLFRCGAYPRTVGSFDWVLGSGDSSSITIGSRGFQWVAIGRWKN